MDYELLSKIYYKDNEHYEMIYSNRLSSYSTCHYDFDISGYPAFLVINSELLELISKILKLDKQLYIATKSIPTIALTQFTLKCLIDEIKLTNELEGISSTRHEINQVLNEINSDKPSEKKNKRLEGLIRKYKMLMQYQDLPLTSCQNVRDIYDDLVLSEIKQQDPRDAPDGAIFRKDGVDVTSASQKVIHKGLVPESTIIEYMAKALDVLNTSENALINIAVFHYLFGYIHPFYDGNGRTSRFISSYMLSKHLDPLVAFGLSYTIKQNVGKYYGCFKYTNDNKNRGDLTGFVIDFLEIVKQSILNLTNELETRREKLDFYRNKVSKLGNGDERLLNIIYILVQNSLFAENGLSIDVLSKICQSSLSTVRNLIKKIPAPMLKVGYCGNKKLYDIDLDVLGEVEL